MNQQSKAILFGTNKEVCLLIIETPPPPPPPKILGCNTACDEFHILGRLVLHHVDRHSKMIAFLNPIPNMGGQMPLYRGLYRRAGGDRGRKKANFN